MNNWQKLQREYLAPSNAPMQDRSIHPRTKVKVGGSHALLFAAGATIAFAASLPINAWAQDTDATYTVAAHINDKGNITNQYATNTPHAWIISIEHPSLGNYVLHVDPKEFVDSPDCEASVPGTTATAGNQYNAGPAYVARVGSLQDDNTIRVVTGGIRANYDSGSAEIKTFVEPFDDLPFNIQCVDGPNEESDTQG
ncbi:MAG: hypothetical protein WA777_12045 [Rhodanobacter sp.]